MNIVQTEEKREREKKCRKVLKMIFYWSVYLCLIGGCIWGGVSSKEIGAKILWFLFGFSLFILPIIICLTAIIYNKYENKKLERRLLNKPPIYNFAQTSLSSIPSVVII